MNVDQAAQREGVRITKWPVLFGLILAMVLVAACNGGSTATFAETSGTPGATQVAQRSFPVGTAGRIAVPSSIDASGATDVTDALLAFIASVPDGSTIVFRAGTTYRLDRALKFASRSGLVFEGNQARLIAGGGTSEANSLFWLESDSGGNRGIRIRDFNLVGNSATPGVYQSGREGAHGILVDGGYDTEIDDVTVSGVWGDCFYVGSWSDTVSVRDSSCRSSGRNGVTVTAGTNVVVERVAFDVSGYSTFDIEPNYSSEGAGNVIFRGNSAGTWTNSFLSAGGTEGSSVEGVTVTGNTVTGATLLTVIDLPRRRNITFTDNTSTVAGEGPVLIFAHVDGLVVTGNRQPLESGTLADISDSTDVIYR